MPGPAKPAKKGGAKSPRPAGEASHVPIAAPNEAAPVPPAQIGKPTLVGHADDETKVSETTQKQGATTVAVGASSATTQQASGSSKKAGAQKPNAGNTEVVECSPSSLTLNNTASNPEFFSGSATLSVESSGAPWSVWAIASAATGSGSCDGASIPASDILFDSLGGVATPSFTYTPSTLNLGTLQEVAVGAKALGSVTKLGSFKLAAQVDSSTPAGTYQGSVTFYLENSKGGIYCSFTLCYSVCVQYTASLTIENAMDFTAPIPGTYYSQDKTSSTCTQVTVTCNNTTTLTLGFGVMSTTGGLSVPGARTCFGAGTTLSSALSAAESASLGTNTVTLTLKSGTTTIYCVGKVETLATDKEGSYSGTFSAQSGVE